MKLRTIATAAAAAVATFVSLAAVAQTSIDHTKIAYFVPEKRVNLESRVMDPKGVKLARVYFKAGAQADYTFVPMQSAGGNRYVATLPAPSAATPSIEYLFLAQNNDGSVSRTDAYTVAARKTNETPAWQSNPSQANVKVYTELTNAPRAVAGFSDSISLDVVESGARLGAVAGLYGGTSGAAGGTAATSTSTTATTATATTATAGGLSTAAIIGGVAIAGAAVAAAAGGGGGGGSGSTAPAPPPSGTLTSTSWSGTWSTTSSYNTGAAPGTCSGTWTGTIDSQNNFSSTMAEVSGNECFGGSFPISGPVSATGAFSTPLPACLPVNNSNISTGVWSGTFSASNRTVSGSLTCPPQGSSNGVSGTWSGRSP